MFLGLAQSEVINDDASDEVVAILEDMFPEGLGESLVDEAIRQGVVRIIYRSPTSDLSLIAC